MKIKFNETPEQLELVRAMGSKNYAEAFAAREAFAALVGPILATFYQQADTTKLMYEDFPFTADSDPSMVLDLYWDITEEYFSIWSAPLPGGAPTNTIHRPVDEVKFTTYRLDSAWSAYTKWARQMRLDPIARSLTRMLQEVLLKTNYAAWSVALSALANARHKYKTNTAIGHVFASAVVDKFTLDDFNQLLTYFRRLGQSWAGGTPVGGTSKPTDMVVSPEIMEKFRAMAYNPINTKAANEVTISANSDASAGATVALSDAQRSALFSSAGVPEFYGINIIELLELGISQDYSILFESYIGSTNLPRLGTGAASGETYAATDDELIIVLDASKPLGYRALARDSDTGSIFTMENDDQFIKRSGKFGGYGGIEEGRLFGNSRGLAALVV